MSPAVALVCEACGKAGQLDPRDAEALLRRSSDGVPLPAGWRQVAAFDTWPAPSMAELPVVCSPACLLTWSTATAEEWRVQLRDTPPVVGIGPMDGVLEHDGDQVRVVPEPCSAEGPGSRRCDLPDDHVGDHRGGDGETWAAGPRQAHAERCLSHEEAAGVVGRCVRARLHPGAHYYVLDDPVPSPASCGVVAPGASGLECTRDGGHPGRHTSRDAGRVLWSWADDGAPPRRVVVDQPQG